MQGSPELQSRVEGVLAVEGIRREYLNDRGGRGARGDGEVRVVAARGHPGEGRVPTGMVMGVTAVGAGHSHYGVVAGAARPDRGEHLQDVVDDPHPDRAPQVFEAVYMVVQRRALGAQLSGQRVDRERVGALAVQECQSRQHDRLPA